MIVKERNVENWEERKKKNMRKINFNRIWVIIVQLLASCKDQ